MSVKGKNTQAKKAAAKKTSGRAKTKRGAGSAKKKATTKKAPAPKIQATKTPAKKPTKKKDKNTSIRKAYWLTQHQMAAAHGITRQAFRAWGVEPVSRVGRYAYYLAGDVTEKRVEYHTKKLVPTARDAEFARSEREAKLRLTKAQAEGQKIKNAQLREELAPLDLISWVLSNVGSQISAILEAIPMKLKKRNSKLTATDIELITREIVKTQNAAARITVDLAEYNERKQT